MYDLKIIHLGVLISLPMVLTKGKSSGAWGKLLAMKANEESIKKIIRWFENISITRIISTKHLLEQNERVETG